MPQNVLGPSGRNKPPHNQPTTDWYLGREGLRVTLRPVQGVTPKRILREIFRFQCPPLDTFHIDFVAAHTDYDTLGREQFSRAASSQLTAVNFETLVVWAPETFNLAKGYFDYKRVTKILKEINTEMVPVQLTAWHGPTRAPVEIDMPVTIRSLGVEERSGEPDARYYSMGCIEWRDPLIKRRDKQDWPQRHELTRNDTLYSLAKKYYGKQSLAMHIGNYNKGLNNWGRRQKIVDHHLYDVGDAIKIPRPPQTGPYADDHAGNGNHPGGHR